MAFCNDCGKTVEWHKTANGKSIALDPDPVPEGTYGFDARLHVVKFEVGAKAKLRTCHFDTCTKRGQGPRRSADNCEIAGCEVRGRHRHCHNCGETDHLAAECPDRAAL